MKNNLRNLAAAAALAFAAAADAQTPRFTGNGDGTVTDNLTGLIWQQNGMAQNPIAWQQQLAYCEGLTLAGRTDWRVPNVKEMASLILPERACVWDDNYFIASCSTSTASVYSYYVTSTTRVDNPAEVWVIINDGRIMTRSKTGSTYVRCVRGG
jgi:hypothetical protein